VLVFAKDKALWRPNKLDRTEEQNAIYKHSDEYDGIKPNGEPFGRGPWFPGDATASLRGGQRGAQFARTGHSSNIYEIATPSGRKILPPSGTCWRYSMERLDELIKDNRITFGVGGNNRPCIKRFLYEIQDNGIVPMTVWHYEDVGENRVAAAEVKQFNSKDPFTTPKPERLLNRIISIGSNPGDWVLDSFGGSGTTGAVAHKMRRRWIMVELEETCHTHIIPRLQKVVDGTDAGGITEAVDWKGGGGFRYYKLAPSLLKTDKWGNLVINKEFNPDMLSEAVCKLEGYTYAPSDTLYWQHGHSSEKSFIYVTTQHLTREQLTQLNDEVGSSRSLLVCCASFRGKAENYPHLEIKKIPKAVLAKCEWGHDDYSLKIENLPKAPLPKGQQQLI